MKIGFTLTLLLMLILSPAVRAADKNDYISPAAGTLAVAVEGGDTVNTYSVSIDSYTGVVLRAAVTNRTRRKLCVKNTSSVFTVTIGSGTTPGADNWTLGESTNTVITPYYCTHSSAQFTGFIMSGGGAGTRSSNVEVIEETESVP